MASPSEPNRTSPPLELTRPARPGPRGGVHRAGGHRRPPAAGGSEIRSDIQGLRAVAVALVLVYHLWPNRLTGGFVGVDVFFVISGFLITLHLLAHPPRRVGDLLTFWGRRIRRLLPASALVLAVTMVATRLVAPETVWAATAREVKAAALYVVNWRLADDSVDYLKETQATSPVLHFWSLSVEEQFYLGWPVLILVLVGLSALGLGRERRTRAIVLAGLGAVTAASLAWSVHDTAAEPARAYFVTPTRIWELGAGGLLAAAVAGRTTSRSASRSTSTTAGIVRPALAWAGFAGIAWAAWCYTGATPFPSWRAALPVLGTVAVIAAHAPRTRLSPTGLLAIRPVQWLGDVSYSLYLWHWPLIVLVPYVRDEHFGRAERIGVLVVSLALAGLTKRFVEDRFRTPRWGRPLWRPYLLGAAAMAVVVSLTVAQLAETDRRDQQARAALQQAKADAGSCFGAAALAAGPTRCPPADSGPLVPAPAYAAKDKSDAYIEVSGTRSCWSEAPAYHLVTCTFGDPDATVNVALVGNSHAGMWLPALEAVAKAEHWRITTYLATKCAMAQTDQSIGTAAADRACRSWSDTVTAAVAGGGFDLVVYTNRMHVPALGHDSIADSYDAYAAGYTAVLTAWHRAGLTVSVIHDTPAPVATVRNPPECLAEHPDDYNQCSGPRSAWTVPDATADAVAALADPRITIHDYSDYFCTKTRCSSSVGGVTVYWDGTHITATFATTLAPYLRPILVAAVNGQR